MGFLPPTCKVLAGSWPQESKVIVGSAHLRFYDKDPMKGEDVQPHAIAAVELATEETVQKLGSTVGLGLVGTALLGPVGLVAGVLMSRKKEATFLMRLHDGRQALVVGDQKAYVQIQAHIMQSTMNQSAAN